MVDNLNPTNQFHPYQPMVEPPMTERQKGGLSSMNWQQPLNKVRDYARLNPSKALGALAAVVIGAGLLRGRR
ncbi:MAG: hypothetical protein QOE68_595 [Thermoanaerobaculia bacterium]|nr:hypothetical protein [Thermoanaerobaculia bacterium]